MLSDFTGADRVYIACGYTDLRRGIDGLAAMVQRQFHLDPFTNTLFLFCGRRRDRIKALYWEGNGFVLLYKRLESGSFQWPRSESEARALTSQQYRWLMEGLSVDQPKAARRSVTVEEDRIYEFRTDADTCINFRVEPVNPFTDVAEDAYYYAPALWAAKIGVTTGTSATTFSPEQTCTRGEIITLLWRFRGSPEPGFTGSAYGDVTDPASYYYKACQWAAEQGMVKGETFAPNDPCTRAMAVEFLWYANQCPRSDTGSGFDDVPAGASYADAVTWAVDWGVTQGTGEGTFSPDLTCTRGQIVTFLFRTIW